MEIDYIQLLFDGRIDEIRKKLVLYIRGKVRSSGCDLTEIDEDLCLGIFSSGEQTVLPSYEEILTDPQKLTGDMFYRFEQVFKINMLDALAIEGRVDEKMTIEQVNTASDYGWKMHVKGEIKDN